MNVILNIARTIPKVALSAAYVVYVLMVIIELAVIVSIDYRKKEMSWRTILYLTIVTAFVLVFNWEFFLLLSLYEEPALHFFVWFAFAVLALGTYGVYVNYPKVRMLTFLGEWRLTRWCNPDNGPPRRH